MTTKKGKRRWWNVYRISVTGAELFLDAQWALSAKDAIIATIDDSYGTLQRKDAAVMTAHLQTSPRHAKGGPQYPRKGEPNPC